MSKTNATRILDRLGIAYTTRAYEVDESDLSAESVAAKLGIPMEQVFKTLVFRDRAVALAVVPAGAALDLKALAKVRKERRCAMVPLKEVQPLTGYIRGGVTALATKKPFEVVLDETALRFEQISVSAGVRGLQLLLHPADYQRATGAQTAAISRPPASPAK